MVGTKTGHLWVCAASPGPQPVAWRAVIPTVRAPVAVLGATPWVLRGVADGIPGTDGRAGLGHLPFWSEVLIPWQQPRRLWAHGERGDVPMEAVLSASSFIRSGMRQMT